jgi:hypothetical protein
MEALMPFQYWTLSMAERHTATLHHNDTVSNDMFDYMDIIMWALGMKKTPRMCDLFVEVKLARQKLSKILRWVTPMMGMLLNSAHIIDPFNNFREFRMWDQWMHIIPADKIFYSTQYQEGILNYVENESWSKDRHVLVNKHQSIPSHNLGPSATTSGSCQSTCDQL